MFGRHHHPMAHAFGGFEGAHRALGAMFFQGMNPFHGHAHGPDALRHARFELGYGAVLESLKDQARSGSEVLAHLEETSCGLGASPELVYPLLQLATDRGHVVAVAAEGPTRYALSEAGREMVAKHENEGCSRVSPELKDELKQTHRLFREAMRALHPHAHIHAVDPEKLPAVMAIVNRALGEIRDLAAS